MIKRNNRPMANFKHLFLDISFTDYKVRSDKFLGGAIYLMFVTTIFFIGCEFFLDLPSTSLRTLIPCLAINILLIVIYLKNVKRIITQTLFLTFAFAIVEIHAIANPESFHGIIYWFPFIPIAAIIISGLKQAAVWLGIIFIANTFNLIYLQNLRGDTYEITISLSSIYVVGLIFTITTGAYTLFLYRLLGEAYSAMKFKSNDLEEMKSKSESKKKKLVEYQKALFDFSKDPALTAGNFEVVYAKVCKIATEMLGVNRVSIWIFKDKSTMLERKFLYNPGAEIDEFTTISQKDFPLYFNNILSDHHIEADNAFVHPDTAEFVEIYLQPLQIFSMLDSLIKLDGKTIGIICCENQGTFRSWSAEDVLFVQSLSDFIAMAFKSCEVRSLLQKIRNQNRDLKEKGKVIEAYNEELSALNEELTIMNESLEVTVQNRTSALEKQNKQLSEYAFINSHMLRAPLSRILGLTYILSKEKLNIKDSKLLNALTVASEDLDSIVRKISALLYKREDFTRNDINEIIERKLKEKTVK